MEVDQFPNVGNNLLLAMTSIHITIFQRRKLYQSFNMCADLL